MDFFSGDWCVLNMNSASITATKPKYWELVQKLKVSKLSKKQKLNIWVRLKTWGLRWLPKTQEMISPGKTEQGPKGKLENLIEPHQFQCFRADGSWEENCD